MTSAATNLLTSLTEAFEFSRNAAAAIPMAKYMKNNFPFLGLPQPVRKALSKEFLQDAKKLDAEDVLAIANKLWKKKEREYQYVAIELLIAGRKKWDEQFLTRFLEMITEKSWWDSVDFIAVRLIGPYFAAGGGPATLQPWLESDNIWQNRTALIFQLSYKEKTDLRFLQKAIKQLKHKDEFFVQKAIGWSLRQYHRIDPDWVAALVEKEGLKGLAKREALKHA
ncbi:MAG: DNA alkylation repair protein [Bacteroidetes bacterium]|nr:DNA alkylation repair protein [Bacteroidota bacterium]